jgi:hypothetical protein
MDLLREIFGELAEGELADMVEELTAFSGEHAHNLTSTLSDEDMKTAGLFSEETLL